MSYCSKYFSQKKDIDVYLFIYDKKINILKKLVFYSKIHKHFFGGQSPGTSPCWIWGHNWIQNLTSTFCIISNLLKFSENGIEIFGK